MELSHLSKHGPSPDNRDDAALSHVPNDELLFCVRTLAGKVREATAKLVAYLGEVEARRLHLEMGFPSMFAFCIGELGMSENEAFRRLGAARLGRRFPVIHSLLASGAVHLSALELLRDRLTEENHAELLRAVSGKSKNEVLVLLAARFPAPDVPTTIRKLSETVGAETGSTFELSLPSAGAIAWRGRIEPLSEATYRVQFTASAELREKLELCRDLMSHANPGRELSVVVERAVDLLLAELEKKRLARTKSSRQMCPNRELPSEICLGEMQPREVAVRSEPARRTKPGGIARATRRRVFERDGLRCTYVSPEGRRCDARAFLELDHIEPRALGGTDDVANLRVRCRSHNQLAAEQVFGRETVERCRHFVRQRCRRETQTVNAPNTLERVRLALKGMGFRDKEARRAVVHVERSHENAQSLALDRALREALLAATTSRS